MKCMIVIPARLQSSRLPEKLLLRAGNKSVLQHTYEAACRSRLACDVVVAVDDARLAEEVAAFGGRSRMTSVDCQSGTDRIAEIARQWQDIDIFVNVQGDEPEIEADTIDAVAQLLMNHPEADMSTAMTPITQLAMLEDPNCVKVLMGANQRAITFSRAAIPLARDGDVASWLAITPPVYFQHIGLYAYRREFLTWFAGQPMGCLEQIERLEQLRAIEDGKTIVATTVPKAAPGIDTLDDFTAFQSRVQSRQS
ncbi:MAG: 3-deoxy-manno-octulosonate cytidylyltransferase [Planctomycetota bacterium]